MLSWSLDFADKESIPASVATNEVSHDRYVKEGFVELYSIDEDVTGWSKTIMTREKEKDVWEEHERKRQRHHYNLESALNRPKTYKRCMLRQPRGSGQLGTGWIM